MTNTTSRWRKSSGIFCFKFDLQVSCPWELLLEQKSYASYIELSADACSSSSWFYTD
jgi:hypothetical protein